MNPVSNPSYLVGGQVITATNLSEEATIKQMLHWIGFRTDTTKNSIFDDGLQSFNDIKQMSDEDVNSMATSFANRTAQNGRMYLGTRRIKYLKALAHWVQDFYRTSSFPTIVGLSEEIFKSQMDRAAAREVIRKNMIRQAKTSAEAASPGPLQKETQWKHWEETFTNYARAHIGASGVPLSYVIRDNDTPLASTTYPDFVSRTIACAPLSGEFYDADKTTVFNMIVSFTTGQPSGDWVKETFKFSDGRRSMQALRNHFAGEGNATRNLAEAERLYQSIHYKNERAMNFEVFLTQCQRMFNIFDKEGEAMAEEAKVRFLFRKIEHPGLQGAIEALKASIATGTAISYTTAANHIATAVSELPEVVSRNTRNISSVSQDDNDNTSSGIYNKDGSIKTGHISGWKSLPFKDRKAVIDERKRLGIRFQKKVGSNDGGRKLSPSDANRLKQLEEQNSKYKRRIKALTRKNNSNTDNDDQSIDAGDQFGGKHAKKKAKKGS